MDFILVLITLLGIIGGVALIRHIASCLECFPREPEHYIYDLDK